MLLKVSHHINQLKPKSLPLRGALLSSGVLAFSGMGDAILYPVLPVYADELGISAIWVGVILSVNRLVRIVANTWIANMIKKIGLRSILTLASFFAVITTIIYGLKFGVLVFVIARLIWGLCYSTLKQSNLTYASMVKKNGGLVFGVVQSFNSLGTLVALWLGPVIISELGFKDGIFLIAIISIPAILIANFLPDLKIDSPKIRTKNIFKPTPINLLIFILSIAIDGIMVVTISKLLFQPFLTTGELVILSGFYLLLKRLLLFVFSLISGFITLRFSALRLFKISIFMCFLALVFIGFGLVKTGLVLGFVFNATFGTLSSLIAISLDKSNTQEVIASTSTWWDFGAAVGAFSGILLINFLGQQVLFFSLSLITLGLILNFIFSINNKSKDKDITQA